MLSAYQFASNSPIWAIDLDGKEALIVHPSNKTAIVFANVYYVTSGEGSVQNINMLKTMVQERLQNRINEANKGIMNGGYTLKFEINHVTTNDNGKPLTLNEARGLAAQSTINYTDRNGQPASTGPDWRTSTVVQEDFTGEIDKQGEGTVAIYKHDKPNKQNTIFIKSQVSGLLKRWEAAVQFTHELGHFLGRWTGSGNYEDDHPGKLGDKTGITSTVPGNVELTSGDIPLMFQGASDKGVIKVGTEPQNTSTNETK